MSSHGRQKADDRQINDARNRVTTRGHVGSYVGQRRRHCDGAGQDQNKAESTITMPTSDTTHTKVRT